MEIYNLTQHTPTEEMTEGGKNTFVTPEGVSELLTFSTFEEAMEEKGRRVEALASLVPEYGIALIGGAPWLMSALERSLEDRCVQYVYAFSERVSEEVQQPDGSVRKVSIFKFRGWV